MLSSTRVLSLVSSQVGGRNWQRQVPGFSSHWEGKEKKCNTLLTSVSQINYSLGLEQRQMLKPLEVKQQQRYCVLIVGETHELKGKTMISFWRSFCKSGYLRERVCTHRLRGTHRLMSSHSDSVSYWMSVGIDPLKGPTHLLSPLTSHWHEGHLRLVSVTQPAPVISTPTQTRCRVPPHEEPAALNMKHFDTHELQRICLIVPA